MPKPLFNTQAIDSTIHEIIMVDHAGEYGAQRIYEGQLHYTNNISDKKIIRKMLEQEKLHLKYFEDQIKSGLGKPTFLIPLWHMLGYNLGAMSAILGSNASMLLTEKIEEVIIEHYQEQIDFLEQHDTTNPILKSIKQFKEEEAEHMHIAIECDSQNTPFYNICSHVIKSLCKVAISLSKKI